MAVAIEDKRQPPTNGSPKGPKALESPNGHAAQIISRGASSKGQRGVFTRSFVIIARLLTWYTIFTVLFRCPDSLVAYNESSPKVCKPYFYAKHAIAPHVSPYYDAYAAPYVDTARPYYVTLNRKVITPGCTYAVKYGGPRVAQVQAFGQAQWEKSVQPQILKYQVLAKAQYDHAISPYVNEAAIAITPYYDIARTNALQTYYEILVPTYTFLHPYANQGYDVAYGFTKNTVVPSTIWAWNKIYAFLDSAIWPHLRDVYILKVEPQLVRIGERLGRIVPKSTFLKPTPSVSSTTSSTTEPTETASQMADTESSHRSDVPSDTKSNPSETPKTKEEIRELAAKTVAEDLELWEGKFTRVAEEGAVEIEDRVDEISARMIERHANTMGKSLVAQLEATVHSEFEVLKKTILYILENSDNASKIDEQVAAAVRGAGLKIKNKAQNIRDWRQSYEQETEIAVTKAAQEHFSIIEQTRDLALQKIGMKWAWMDGVTYKDWQKYHQLRARFEEWTDELKRLITTHPGLVAAQTAGTDVEDEGMAVAHEAAVELGRLKQVAAWKATAQDFTDDFDSNTMQLAAEERIAAAAESARLAAEAAAEKATRDADDLRESISEVVSFVEDTEEAETVTVSLSRNNDQEQEGLDSSALPLLESLATEPTDSANDLSSEFPSTRNSESQSSTIDSTSTAKSVEPLPSSDPLDAANRIEETLEAYDLPIHSTDEEAAPASVEPAPFGAAAASIVSDAVSSGLEAASENIASVTDKVKDAAGHIKDEL
ncbi:hypothetical protein GQX73_g10926 [Xylaria multiplex]|uniref:Transcription factor hoxa13 n=1 Tax=Xylaria multiplex TaxID=323545 RepID=A0A7C8MKW8_9PEZI|nr:hypothetical protein GQX73_g10926 [Xylaria multiplex]